MNSSQITDELPITGWALDYLRGHKVPSGVRLLAMYFAGWAYGLFGQWPPDRLPSPKIIATELGCTEILAKKYLEILDDIGFLAELDKRRGLSA